MTKGPPQAQGTLGSWLHNDRGGPNNTGGSSEVSELLDNTSHSAQVKQKDRVKKDNKEKSDKV